MLTIFSCTFWPSVCLLWRNVYLDLLPIFSFFFLILRCRRCLYILEINHLSVTSSFWNVYNLFFFSSIFLLLAQQDTEFILYFPSCSPRISHCSKEPWSFYWRLKFRIQGLGAKCTYSILGVTSSGLSVDKAENICVYTSLSTDTHTHTHIYTNIHMYLLLYLSICILK